MTLHRAVPVSGVPSREQTSSGGGERPFLTFPRVHRSRCRLQRVPGGRSTAVLHCEHASGVWGREDSSPCDGPLRARGAPHADHLALHRNLVVSETTLRRCSGG